MRTNQPNLHTDIALQVFVLTWIVFMTPLARTAILPATVFTPCLNCVISGPEGSTLSKPEALPDRIARDLETRSGNK